MNPIIKKIKRYSVDLCRQNLDHLFIFGSNLIKRGHGGQAIISDESNSYGIPTKKHPSMRENAFFNDGEYEKNIKIIKESIDNIPLIYEYIVFPEDGLGTGLAQLPLRAPRTYRFLVSYLNSKFGDIYE
jgi:hypothetical protein